MLFVFRVAIESGRTEYRVFRKLADALQHLRIARDAFDNGREMPDGEMGLVTDYAVLRMTTEDVRAAADQAKKGDGLVVHDLEKDRREREAARIRHEAEQARRAEADRAYARWVLSLLNDEPAP